MSMFPDFRDGATGKVVDFSRKLKRKQFHQKHRWELSREHLDWIATDVWPSDDEGGVGKVTVASGRAPKRPPLTYDADLALRDIHSAVAGIQFKLEQLSEPALKGLAFEAREKAELEGDLWQGVAAECDHRREIKSRRRTGRGVWFAVIEAERSLPGRDYTEVDEVAFEKCQGRKAAVSAARRLLKEKADTLDEQTMLRAALYCDLEWTPPKRRLT